jgi:hypothetical protein
MTQVFAERGNFAARLIFNDDAVACGAGIAAGAAVDVSDEMRLGRGGLRGEQSALGQFRFAKRRHPMSLQR